ncbi:MAG: sigma-70 family RNA polymerase sigma factor [Polyangiales bacterium]
MCKPGIAREVSVTKVRWLQVSVPLRGSASPWSHPGASALYGLLFAEGVRALRGYRAIDPARRDDLISEVFVRALPRIVAADDPCAYFRTALAHEARSWLRRRGSRVCDAAAPHAEPRHDGEAHPVARLTLRALARSLSPREQQVFLGLMDGEDRDALARRLHTSRANIDQIVHRARARLIPRA